ncbi:MAG: translation initiation factor IF-3 [Erysipelotrichaceae bacterium]|jgi:translation initiation factor IF-3|nr:MAG: translation initiation factor [Erysipelotrichaceae bacterium]TXT18258.1 MAG: translation initiation factor IF-3 [Erysipelotrichaceae bacterium]
MGTCYKTVLVLLSGKFKPAFYLKMEDFYITKRPVNDELVNENIRFKEVLVIGPNGEQLGHLMRREALEKAYDYGLDLFCVAPNAVPPVCKIMDYGKYRFEQQKKLKEAKKNQQVTEVKPLRLSPVIDTHDFETKLNHAKEWIAEGLKVRIDMRFRGRLITHIEVGQKVMDEFARQMSEVAVIEKPAVMDNRTMILVLSPKKTK